MNRRAFSVEPVISVVRNSAVDALYILVCTCKPVILPQLLPEGSSKNVAKAIKEDQLPFRGGNVVALLLSEGENENWTCAGFENYLAVGGKRTL